MEFVAQSLFLIESHGYRVKWKEREFVFEKIPGSFPLLQPRKVFKTIEHLEQNKMHFLVLLILLFACFYFSIQNRSLKTEFMEEIHHPINILSNTRNSCYQDVVLVSLFATKNTFIHNQFFMRSDRPKIQFCESKEDLRAIRNELFSIYNSIRKKSERKDTCSSLRNLLGKCRRHKQHEFHLGGMEDAEEFVVFLFELFGIEGVVKERITYAANKGETPVPTSFISESSSPVILVPFTDLRENIRLDNFLEKKDVSNLDSKNLFKYDGQLYNTRIQISSVVKAEYLIFSIQRLFSAGIQTVRNFHKVVPEAQIRIGQKVLSLTSIVVHKGHHYTAYIKVNSLWYYYDDLRSNLKLIGSMESMLSSSPEPTVYGTLFFYG